MSIDVADHLPTEVRVFVDQRPRLFGIAYRILRSTDEAEDVVQDAWLRWQRTERRLVEDPAAFLAVTTRRLALNVLQSAHRRHETPGTEWSDRAPAPATTTGGDPHAAAERTETVEVALRLVLERLTLPERVAFVLRAGFDYPYERIAGVLHVSTVNARQMVSRAHGHLRSDRRHPVDAGVHRRLVEAFVTAARAGELSALEALLSTDLSADAA